MALKLGLLDRYMVTSGDSGQFGQMIISMVLGGWWVNAIKAVAFQMSQGTMSANGEAVTQGSSGGDNHGAVIVQPVSSTDAASGPVLRGIVVGGPTLIRPDPRPEQPAADEHCTSAADVSILALDSPRTEENPAARLHNKGSGTFAP